MSKRKRPQLGGKNLSTVKISQKQIKRNVGRFVREVPGSGNKPLDKGDVEVGQVVLLEAKTTVSGKSMTLKLEWLEKAVEEAADVGKYPALLISFEKAKVPVPKDWVLVPRSQVVWGEDVS